MSRVLVTGASGFLGRAAVPELEKLGFEVIGVSRADADLLDHGSAERVVEGARPSHLLHLAWTTEHGRYWEDPANDAWVAATARLVEAFAAAGGSRTVFAGSCAQYEWTSEERLSEMQSPRRPATRYGRAKEEAARLFAATAILFFPYGPHEHEDRLVPSLVRHLLAGEEAPVSAGTQVRDFIHVQDCGTALAAILESEVRGAVNIGTGNGTPVAEAARRVAEIAGRPELLRIGALPGGDDTRVVADVTRLHDEVGFEPRHGLNDGLRATVEWWRQRTRRR